jgi:hypothetical protein
MVGPPPWRTLELFEPGTPDGPISRRAFDLVWEEFSKRAARVTQVMHGGEDEVRLYAEKHLMTWRVDLEPLPPLKVLAVVRDPRDVWVSVRAVNARRWGTDEPLIGRDPVENEEEWLVRFLSDQRERNRWLVSLTGADVPVFRYEDLVEDLPGQAERLEQWLGVSVDAKAVLADDSLRTRHASTPSASESIGRWREDLSSAEATRIAEELEPELDALGYS